MRGSLSEADQFTIGTGDDYTEPIVRAPGEGLVPLLLANGEGGARTAVCLDECGHVEVSHGGYVGCGGSAKPKIDGGHSVRSYTFSDEAARGTL